MKGISPIISVVLLILIAVLLSIIVSNWMTSLTRDVSTDVEENVGSKIACEMISYDFDTDYGNYGILYNFSGNNDTISVKIINTGNENIYNFGFEITLKRGDEYIILKEPYINVSSRTQYTKAYPLKPGNSAILEAKIIDINETWELYKVKITNGVCGSFFIESKV